jgi:polyhydroxyalkanoate synthesis regulator phasin
MEYRMSVSRKSIVSSLLAGGLLISLIGAAPANANPVVALSVNGVAITTANVSGSPAVIPVPADNSVDAPDAVRFSLTSVTAGTTVTVSTTNAFIIPALSTTLNPVRSASGVNSAAYNVGTGTTSEFFAYTRSTGLGVVTITNGGSTFTYYLRGSAGAAHTISYTPNENPFTSTFVKQSVSIKDIFGNPVSGVIPTISLINLTSTTPTASNAEGVSEFTVTYPATPGRSALSIGIPAVDVVGLTPAIRSIATFIDVVDATSEINKAIALAATEKAALEAEKAARAADKAAADAALAAEKAARVADKAAADAALATEKAARAAEKVVTDKALADEKAARLVDKTTNDRNIATLNSKVAELTKQIKDLKALYNKLAVKFKQKTIK